MKKKVNNFLLGQDLDLESISDEEFEYLLKIQNSESKDAKDFGPYWLEGIQGSLAEERRKSNPNKDLAYNSLACKARRDLRREGISILEAFTNPSSLTIKLSEFWARYPSLEIKFSINVQRITKSSLRLLRSFLLWYYPASENFDDYMKFFIEEDLDRILQEKNFQKNEKLLKEVLIIRKTFLLAGPNLGLSIIKQVYSQDNLERWNTTILKILSKEAAIDIPLRRTKLKVQRRGYRESHSNKHKSKDQRGEVAMSKESRSLEEIREQILKKQAILFERRLDQFLRLEDPNTPQELRKQIFNQLLDGEFPSEENEINLELQELQDQNIIK